MAGGGLRGIMAIRPWTPCRVRHHRPNGRIAITAAPSPARHPHERRTDDVAGAQAVPSDCSVASIELQVSWSSGSGFLYARDHNRGLKSGNFRKNAALP